MTKYKGPPSRKWLRLTDEILEQKVRENGGPIKLNVPLVTSVDLHTGSAAILEPSNNFADESSCLSAWIDAQSEFVALPVIGAMKMEGYRMTGRAMAWQGDDSYPTPSANLLIIESPNQVWALTVGVARREPIAKQTWELLVKMTSKVATRLEYPPLPWIAWSVSAGNGASVVRRVPTEIELFLRTMVSALLPYYAMVDYVNDKS